MTWQSKGEKGKGRFLWGTRSPLPAVINGEDDSEKKCPKAWEVGRPLKKKETSLMASTNHLLGELDVPGEGNNHRGVKLG